MKFTTSALFTLLTTALTTIPSVFGQPPAPTILNYDTSYDNPNGLLAGTACPAAGVLSGIKNFGSIPNFPHIAGSAFAEGFNSTSCGACYELSYVRPDGPLVVIPFTIINGASGGFISSLSGLEDLTGLPRDQIPGDVRIDVREVPSYDCGFPMN